MRFAKGSWFMKARECIHDRTGWLLSSLLFPWTMRAPRPQLMVAPLVQDPGQTAAKGSCTPGAPPLPLSQSAGAKAEGLPVPCHQHVFISWNGFIFYLLNWIAFRKGWGGNKNRFYGHPIRGSWISFEQVRMDVFQLSLLKPGGST